MSELANETSAVINSNTVNESPAEEWRDIPRYDGVYQISNMGRVRKLPKYRELGLSPQYVEPVVRLTKDGVRTHYRLVDLVAEVFLVKPFDATYIRYRDNNRLNVTVSNIYWETASDTPDELWLPVVGYEGLYEVSDKGRVRETRTGCIIKAKSTRNADKHLQVHLSRFLPDGTYERKFPYVHRLVMEAFTANTDNKPQIDHINGNPADNRLENLRWATAKENSNNPITRARISKAAQTRWDTPDTRAIWLSGNRKHARAVLCINTGKRYKCASEAAEDTGDSVTSIYNRCLRHEKTGDAHLRRDSKLKLRYRFLTEEEKLEYYASL